MRAGIGIPRTGGFGGGLVRAATDVQSEGMNALGKAAGIEQRRAQTNKTIEDSNKAGNAQLGATVGSAAGFAIGGPLGSILGGIGGGLIGGLF